jgi:hypothetical protein
MSGTEADVVAEARRVIGAIDSAGIPARVLGGVAVAMHAHHPLPPALSRTYADIDLAVASRHEGDLRRLLEESGYEGDRKFNALYGYKRQLYWDHGNDRQLDVFVGRFAMCHALDLDGRLSDASGTLRPADLLLTKLQIVEVNLKDIVDGLALVDLHATGREAEGDVIGLDRIAAVTGSDWGWFATASDMLDRLEAGAATLDAERAATIRSRLAEIRTAMASVPKSLRWRARARVGRRFPWYELPEEHVRRGL